MYVISYRKSAHSVNIRDRKSIKQNLYYYILQRALCAGIHACGCSRAGSDQYDYFRKTAFKSNKIVCLLIILGNIFTTFGTFSTVQFCV
jgi:hypothetical protein